MDGTETRQRRLDSSGKPGDLELPHPLSTGGLPAASEDGALRAPESQSVAPKPLETEPSKETAWSISLQVTMPFMFAGLGLSWAGVLLDYFQALSLCPP
ncbi:hypothetical protein P7K49_030990 [Saguinus oedipus]|uniref:Solute carrier family 41 member 3 n=1 Tax=Saguinus oedipus TaxID=9490 RepID=A0ABQ9U3V2_SAGOE|nr:hypothetical protein P7K49_030990 [Saguinus oedipus]